MSAVPQTTVEDFRSDLLEWSEDNFREFPWRDPSLSLYEVLIAEFLLSRTRAQVVSRVFPEFMEEFPGIAAVRTADQDEIAAVIRPTGLQNMRAKALKEIAEALEEEETVPRTQEKLQNLPRVGEYVANATLCFALCKPLPIQDTNVTRIFNRLLGDNWPSDEAEQRSLLAGLVPVDTSREYNFALLDFGAEVCTARSPQCEACFASDYCSYYDECE